MSYEVEAIDASAGSAPAAIPVMKEERVISPYQTAALRVQKLPIGQPDNVESPAPVETRPAEDSVKLSPAANALARRELKFRQQQQALERDRAAITAQQAEMAQLREMKEKLAAKDFSAFDDLVNYDEYSQYKLNKLQGVDPSAEALSQVRGKVESLEKTIQDNIKNQYNAAVSERRIATADLVDKTDRFPKIKKADAHEAVVKHILDTFEHDSIELTIEQAAKEVEMILAEKAAQWKSLLDDDQLKAIEEPRKQLPPYRQSLKTLTNQVTAGQLAPRKPLHLLNDAERYAEARRRAEEKLQNR